MQVWKILFFYRIELFLLFGYWFCWVVSVDGTDSNGKILCLIHTATPSHHTRAKTVLETWAKKCDSVLFFTDSPMNFTYPHIFFPHLKTRDHSWEKIRRAFKYAYSRTKGSFDWYLRADDDAFLIMENAKKFLQNYNASKDYLFGFRWGHFEPTGYADGGSYILSRTAMESFIEVMKEEKTCPEFHRAEEDQELSRCLSRIGIFPEDTRDNYGRERFHHFHPDEERNNFMKKKFLKRNAYYSHEWYPEHVSDTTISFHHLSPYEMRLANFLLYKVKINQD